MELLRSVTGRILVEGHRGAEGIAVENTWQAIETGYGAGADLLELDVQRSADGMLVIYHNYHLPDGRWIRELNGDDLHSVIFKGHSLVFLEDVLEWTKDKPIGLSLDIKNGFGFDHRLFLDTLARVELHDLTERVILVGWDHAGLLLSKKRNPTITTRALLRGRPVDIVQMARNAQVDAVNLDADMVTGAEINALHDAGIAVVVAEMVNPDFSRPVKLGADVICCKDPRAARAMMPTFCKRFYQLGGENYLDVNGYRTILLEALNKCVTPADRDKLLRQEAVEITRHITDGIRDLVKHEKRIRHIVLDLGAVPLATWAEALDSLAEHSMPALKLRIVEMQRELEHGRIEGFPGTMTLYGKPTFATFEGFYQIVFEQAGC